MKDRQSFSDKLARAVIRYTSPAILGVLVLLLIAMTKSSGLSSIVVSEAVLLLSFVILPLVYIYLRTAGFKNGGRLFSDPTLYLRNHPKDILVLGLLFGLPCLGILAYFGAPSALIATLTALLGISLIVALFNLVYRVSYHLAAVTAILISAVLTWGSVFLVLFAAVPVVGWAKYRAHEHTFTQIIVATILSTVATLIVFYYFGLL